MATSTDLRAAIEEVQNQLPGEQLDGGMDDAYDADLASRIEQRVGALPWWVISAVVHSVIFLLCTLIGVALPPPNMDEVTITTDMAKKEEPKYDQKKKRDVFKNPQEVKADKQVENPVVIHEQAEIAETFETDNNMDNQNARGQEDAISDIPLGGTGVTGSMGVGGGGMAGCFGYRDGGGRRKAVARFGGSPATESAVEAALRWLKRHQEADGSWDARKYEATKGGSDNTRIRVGCTALALLAFLGAGHTEKTGKFRDNVRRAQSWLIKQQKASGIIAERESGGGGVAAGYNHSVAGLALAEAYGMARNPQVKIAAQKAVDYTMKHQSSYSGWRYDPRQGADTSVTGWFVMQLKSAKIAGLRVDAAGFQGASNFLNKVTNKQGRSWYGASGHTRPTPAMTSVAMVCRQFMGTPNSDPLLKGGASYLKTSLPDWNRANTAPASVSTGDLGFYYWYYGTLAMFQMGGAEWTAWNGSMKKTMLENQSKGGPMDGSLNDKDGSWDPNGSYIDKYGGRVFTTALGALTLEVYYRYLPMYTK
jgi:Squalene-hopene cyclase C-terminal domain